MADPIGSFSGLASGIQWRDMVDRIMQLEYSRRIAPLEDRVAAAEKTRNAWNSYNSLLSKLTTASDALRNQSAFTLMKSSASLGANDKSLLTASASAGASPGSYQVEVIELARAEKLSGGSFASTTSQLGLTGEFHVNGRAVTLAATDSLAAVRDKINLMNSGATPTGVTATILSTSSTEHRLVLTSDSTGSRGIELVDGAGGALQSLGIVSSTLSQNNKPGDSTKTQSQRVSSHTAALAALLGVSSPPVVTTIVVDGRKISVDLENDTLLSIAYRIDAAGGDAEVTDEVVGGKTLKRLTVAGEVTADASGTDPAASQRIVELLGFQTRDRSGQITSGRDSKFRIDGFTMTRRTNTVSDAIAGVSLNLAASNSALRTSSVTGALSVLSDPKTIDSGTYDISLITAFRNERTSDTDSADIAIGTDPGVADGTYAVTLSETITRSTSATAGLSVLASPGTVTAGTYAVNITTAASVAAQTGAGFGASYNGPLVGSDTITIADGSGTSAAISLTDGQSLSTIISNMNSAFAANGVAMTASDVGGQLKLTSTTGPGAASTFTVTSSNSRVANNFGISDGTYAGTDVAGTIGGIAATGVGDVLTGSSGAVAGLQVEYSGSALGAVGSATVTDTAATTGGTIGGFAATWDANTGTLTADVGSSLAGLSVTYSGAATSGAVGNVVVVTTAVEYISGATIDGETAVWDSAAGTITGGSGTRFEGLELDYTGGVASGVVGELTVDGDIAVEVNVSRDVDGTVNKVKELAAAYNELISFVDKNRVVGGAFYANGSVRAMQDTVRRALVTGVEGLSSTNLYTHSSIAGVALTKEGTLSVDAAVLKAALETNHTDVRALFSTAGTPTDSRVTFLSGGDLALAGNYAISITTAAAQASHTGSVWGGTYSATDGVDDDLTITNSSNGVTTTFSVAHGKTLSQVVEELNVRFQEEGLDVTASDSGGALKLSTGTYGSTTTLTVGGAAATPLGLTSGTYTGIDIAGTIGGLAATGLGTLLTGSTGAAEGMQISYSDSATGSVGDVGFVLGVGGTLDRLIKPLTRAGDGAVVTQISNLDTNILSLNRRMDDAESRLEIRRQALISQFTRMESALSLLQSQGARLQSQLGTLQTGSQR